MRTQTAVLAICLLLLLALAPWLVSSCAQRPLLPDELRQARTAYEAHVDAVQAATMEAQRQGDSIRKVIALGTVAVTVGTTAALTITTLVVATATLVLPSPTAIVAPDATITQRTTRETTQGSSVVIVRTTVLTPTVMTTVTNSVTTTASITATGTVTSMGTTRVVVIRANATPAAPTSAPVDGNHIPSVRSRPAGFVGSVDVISEEMLAEQMHQDASDAAISDLIVNLTPDGFMAFGNLAVSSWLKRPIEMRGYFAVENDSLVATVTSIYLNGLDVTEQYRSDLQTRINWRLYQLLPKRYVQSFEAVNGQVVVHSQMRHQ